MSVNPSVQIRISTTRGRWSIEGVAVGQFDHAIITHSEAAIRDVTGIELFMEPIGVDRLLLAANSSPISAWTNAWNASVRRPVTARELSGLPANLAGTRRGRREQFDQWSGKMCEQLPIDSLDVGGWQNILSYVQLEIGVELVSEQSLQSCEQKLVGHRATRSARSIRALDEHIFVPGEFRVFARKHKGHNTPIWVRSGLSFMSHYKWPRSVKD